MSIAELGLKFEPVGAGNPHVIGRIVDIKRRSGIELAGGDEVKGRTLLLVVDVVGPGVDRCKVGDVILYFKCSHVWLRDGTHAVVVRNDEIISVVKGVDWELFEVEGEKKQNGQPRGRIVAPQ